MFGGVFMVGRGLRTGGDIDWGAGMFRRRRARPRSGGGRVFFKLGQGQGTFVGWFLSLVEPVSALVGLNDRS